LAFLHEVKQANASKKLHQAAEERIRFHGAAIHSKKTDCSKYPDREEGFPRRETMRSEDLMALYRSCQLCPRRCGANRLEGQRGYCREGAEMRVALVEPHFGEEPPFTGTRGSGTVFFSGCSLKCRYCQNYQISMDGLGRHWSVEELCVKILELKERAGIHNVNFVTPDHFFPHTVLVVSRLRESGFQEPVIYNLSGYQAKESLALIEPCADIYLPDFKYGDSALAEEFSRAADYPQVALEAISEMVRQKGFLEPWPDPADQTEPFPETARRGVLVRHLVLPGHIPNSMKALTMLRAEFGRDLPLSLMSQYCPPKLGLPGELSRPLKNEEFLAVLEYVMDLGFRRILYQPLDPEPSWEHEKPFLPDFTRERPFPGNVRSRAQR
jgi:putative pyruvate formate lyase activating enzyme